MNKVFEKNKILIPISAVLLVILFSIIEILLRFVVAPESWISSTIPQTILSNLIKLVLSAIFIFLTTKVYKLKIGFGKSKLVKGLFWYGLVVCIRSVYKELHADRETGC